MSWRPYICIWHSWMSATLLYFIVQLTGGNATEEHNFWMKKNKCTLHLLCIHTVHFIFHVKVNLSHRQSFWPRWRWYKRSVSYYGYHSVCWDIGVTFITNTVMSIPLLSIPLLFTSPSLLKCVTVMFIFVNMHFVVNPCWSYSFLWIAWKSVDIICQSYILSIGLSSVCFAFNANSGIPIPFVTVFILCFWINNFVASVFLKLFSTELE